MCRWCGGSEALDAGPMYSGSALFRWLDKQFDACPTRCVGSGCGRFYRHIFRVRGTDILLWLLAGSIWSDAPNAESASRMVNGPLAPALKSGR